MFTEDFLELIENISVGLIDLDEKDNAELGSILILFDKIKDDLLDTNNADLKIAFTAVYEQIEKLILKDIDPIKDLNAAYKFIYTNFDKLKTTVSKIERKKISPSGDILEQTEAADVENKEPTAENLIQNKEVLDGFDMDTPEVLPEPVVEPETNDEKIEPPIVNVPVQPEKSPEKPAPKSEPSAPADVLSGDALNDTDDDIFMDFVNEAKEYVATLENLMLDLEQTPHDLGLINEIFRPFHTLKGVSGFMGLNKINHIAHEAENILDKARNGKLDITPDHCAVIFRTIDLLKKITSELDVNNKRENATDEEVEALVTVIQASNEPGWIMDGSTRDAINKDLKAENDEPSANPFEEIKKEVGEAFQASKTANTTPQPTAPQAPPAAEGGDHKNKLVEDSIRVKIDKLDFLIDMVGELVITYNLFHQDKNILNIFDHEFQKKKSQLQRVISDLQKSSMSLRMVPIGQTFTKMKRVIRDYTAQHKKTIDLVLIGEDTEIDRNMVDSLNEPLVHMIRNSCDHGIENPDERLANGKAAKGTITLQAYHKGNTIVIDVKDDGHGLNKDKILAKAIQKGLITEGQTLTDSQIYNLVFLPGFSTMEVVSNVSGRGVGMDVVMQAIKLLGGNVEILSEPGKGSTFRIALPLTLAIIDGLLVEVSNELYIIPIANVRRSLKPSGDILNSVMNKAETVKIENQLIPIVRLNRKFRFLPQHEDLSDCILIIIQSGEKVFSIAVDKIITIQSIVVKTLGEKFKDLDGISGATIMGDGKVGLILDCTKLDIEK